MTLNRNISTTIKLPNLQPSIKSKLDEFATVFGNKKAAYYVLNDIPFAEAARQQRAEQAQRIEELEAQVKQLRSVECDPLTGEEINPEEANSGFVSNVERL